MHRPAIDIYSGALVEITTSCLADLRRILRTDGRVYVYAANGHGAWEAALTNVLSRGELVLVLDSGRFARGWGEMAAVLGVEVEVLPGSLRRAVDPAALEARLRADPQGSDQGDPRGAGRYRLGRGQRHRRAAPRDRRRGPRGAADGRHDRLARHDAVRDGRLGRRRRGRGRAEGPDDAAGPGLRRRRRAGARGAPDAPGCARCTGTGPRARGPSTTRNTAARRPSI